jgi:hypothetical protein
MDAMRVIRYAAAGAAGIVAMEVVSYLDMLARGRPASEQPQQLGDRLAERLDVGQGTTEAAQAQRQALGALAGYIDGLVLPTALALIGAGRWSSVAHVAALTVGAMIGSSALPVALGITDPRRWTLDDWLTDLWPHLGYGVTATLVSRHG